VEKEPNFHQGYRRQSQNHRHITVIKDFIDTKAITIKAVLNPADKTVFKSIMDTSPCNSHQGHYGDIMVVNVILDTTDTTVKDITGSLNYEYGITATS
jgi:hypothetical protein